MGSVSSWAWRPAASPGRWERGQCGTAWLAPLTRQQGWDKGTAPVPSLVSSPVPSPEPSQARRPESPERRSCPEGPAGAPPAGPEGRRCLPAARLQGVGGCFPPAARCAPRTAPAASAAGPGPPGPERKALSCPRPQFDSRCPLAGNSSPISLCPSGPELLPNLPWTPKACDLVPEGLYLSRHSLAYYV